jgi:hypothetical protein
MNRIIQICMAIAILMGGFLIVKYFFISESPSKVAPKWNYFLSFNSNEWMAVKDSNSIYFYLSSDSKNWIKFSTTSRKNCLYEGDEECEFSSEDGKKSLFVRWSPFPYGIFYSIRRNDEVQTFFPYEKPSGGKVPVIPEDALTVCNNRIGSCVMYNIEHGDTVLRITQNLLGDYQLAYSVKHDMEWMTITDFVYDSVKKEFKISNSLFNEPSSLVLDFPLEFVNFGQAYWKHSNRQMKFCWIGTGDYLGLPPNDVLNNLFVGEYKYENQGEKTENISIELVDKTPVIYYWTNPSAKIKLIIEQKPFDMFGYVVRFPTVGGTRHVLRFKPIPTEGFWGFDIECANPDSTIQIYRKKSGNSGFYRRLD